MNSAQNDGVPDLVNPTWEDAACAIGSGDHLFTGSGDEGNTFGNGVLITTTKILAARHTMPDQTTGYHVLPQSHSASARVARFRRKTAGTAPVNGTVAGSHDVYISGYLVPPSGDAVLCDLATPVTHITPLPVDTGHPTAADPLRMVGWGSTDPTLFIVVMPLDARVISSKTILGVNNDVSGRATYFTFSGVNPGPNIYDSGGPVLRQVGGVWKVCGVVGDWLTATAIEQYLHEDAFQIPGLYTAAAHPAIDPTSWLRSADTELLQSTPTADLSAQTPITVNMHTGKGADNALVVFTGFDSSGIAGKITAATLVLWAADTGSSFSMRVRRIRRAGVTALANYNTYDGTNNWAAAGAQDTTLDVYTTNQFTVVVPATSQGDMFSVTDAGLLAMLNAARAEDGVLRLLLESVTDLAGGLLRFYAADVTEPSLRPRLEVGYQPPSCLGSQLLGTNVRRSFARRHKITRH